MPIELYRLVTKFVQAPPTTIVCELLAALSALPPAARSRWYVVTPLDVPGPQVVASVRGGFELVEATPGYAVVLPMHDLVAAPVSGRDVPLDVPLNALPGLLRPALMLERTLMGEGRARREWLPDSQERRLVVLEAGAVIGLLTGEVRAGVLGGMMDHLFGQEQPRTSFARGRVIYRCPSCPAGQNTYDFADLIDLSTNKLICPLGHVIQE